MDQFFQELSKLSAPTLAGITALAGLVGVVITALVGIGVALIGKYIVGVRDRQDREVEWRKHAIELTKLDLERKLKTRAAGDTTPMRPSILDFLANYRDLQELGAKTPAQLWKVIRASRIGKSSSAAPIVPDTSAKAPEEG